jgi:hypothetical protein
MFGGWVLVSPIPSGGILCDSARRLSDPGRDVAIQRRKEPVGLGRVLVTMLLVLETGTT